MNILVVIKNTRYNKIFAQEVGRLLANTWANITVLGYVSLLEDEQSALVRENLVRYREDLLAFFPDKSGPYNNNNRAIEWFKQQDGSYIAPMDSGQKHLNLVLVNNLAAKEAIRSVKRRVIDLLILEESPDLDAPWMEQAVVTANSILVVKGIDAPKQIVCCLKHDNVSHKSLEMINQLVTLYSAELKIVGFSNCNNNEGRIEARLRHLLDYYTALKLTPWLELADCSIMDQFIHQEAKKNLVAIWCEEDTVCNFSFVGEANFPILLLH